MQKPGRERILLTDDQQGLLAVKSKALRELTTIACGQTTQPTSISNPVRGASAGPGLQGP